MNKAPVRRWLSPVEQAEARSSPTPTVGTKQAEPLGLLTPAKTRALKRKKKKAEGPGRVVKYRSSRRQRKCLLNAPFQVRSTVRCDTAVPTRPRLRSSFATEPQVQGVEAEPHPLSGLCTYCVNGLANGLGWLVKN